MSGIRTIDILQQKCWIDEQTKCWHWRGGRDSHNAPKCWHPVAKRTVSLGTMIGSLLTGEMPERQHVWYVTCSTPDCANPEHRKRGTKSQQMRALKYVPTELTKAKIRLTKRAKSIVSEDDAEQIRSSVDTAEALGKRYGISPSYAARIRRGEHFKPLLASTASVFSWRPVA